MVGFGNILIFVANGLNLISTLMTNQILLRGFNLIANLCLITYGVLYVNNNEKLNFVIWRIIFILLQVYQITKLYFNNLKKTN